MFPRINRTTPKENAHYLLFPRTTHSKAHLKVETRASLASCGTASLLLSLNTTSAQNHRLATLSSNKPRENGNSLLATCLVGSTRSIEGGGETPDVATQAAVGFVPRQRHKPRQNVSVEHGVPGGGKKKRIAMRATAARRPLAWRSSLSALLSTRRHHWKPVGGAANSQHSCTHARLPPMTHAR